MQDTPVQSLNSLKRDLPSGSTHAQPGAGLLFLREEELRVAQDMMFFAMRDITSAPMAILSELGFGRAHHRTLHWIGRKPGLTVGELLSFLGITKQSLTRVLGPLIRDGYVAQTAGAHDRRQRLLTLTEKGQALERRLFDCQRDRFLSAYREAGGPAVEGFRRVLRGLTLKQGRDYIDSLDAHRSRGPR
ncbi:MarR family transcriptional regulator [Acidocella aquatica]|uniref:MarR family transcriptional regulator n=1 Tax=Acidocella aquatica TaxID=1922313 RepID=A0ABQ6A7I2_9PROT|nr:MarR family transcriptional regulator [Acidocella aquatica]GLR67667.1 MarR family transcriptional regulator [Acidocella aquatica]